jgi:hypothetical protein
MWDTMRLEGWAKTKTLAYFYDGGKWKYAGPGDKVFGYVMAQRLEIEAAGSVKILATQTPITFRLRNVALFATYFKRVLGKTIYYPDLSDNLLTTVNITNPLFL